MKKPISTDSVTVIGGGLAGCEAAWQIAQRGMKVRMFDMKPIKFSPAHKNPDFCELVCSNSLKAERVDSAAGLLKEELRSLNSLVVSCADNCKVPAGGALAVDREKFSHSVTEKIMSHPNITTVSEEVREIPDRGIRIIATGPLTSDALAEKIKERCLGFLSFYDAAAPIVTAESIDMSEAYYASRYGKGKGDDYLNCPLNKEQYTRFYEALISAERAAVHGFDEVDPKLYQGCMPVEAAASQGFDTLRYGPMKPVGLIDPKTLKHPFAVVQLRKENAAGTLYNMVGFQTGLKFGEQKRVFGIVPALRNAEIVRYGVMHRNTFIDSPGLLNSDYSMRTDENLFFAGQITGVEGYMESVSSGLIAGINAARRIRGKTSAEFPRMTMTGALSGYISDPGVKNFQPMGANFGILAPADEHIRDKRLRYRALAERSLKILESGDFT